MKWYEHCYNRLLIDNHITDLEPSFMSRFDPETYVRMVELAGCESAMVYACDHNGNCYYPTRCGHRHGGIGGRDVFGETVELLRQRNIVPIAYDTVLYHNDSVARFPEATQRDVRGRDFNRRYRVACPNSPASTDFYLQQLEEILHYPVDGIFIDMSFWAMFCCCDNCRRAYRTRFGRELPTVIDWRDENWRNYIRFREESVAEFAEKLSDEVRRLRPEISVTHQFSGIMSIGDRGQSGRFRSSCDYASGDFYGGRNQQRFGVKVFDAYTLEAPYEYMTSRCVNLNDHTSTKSDDDLFLHALTTLANGGAYFFIDAINPDGTLEQSFYRRLGRINRNLAPFRQVVEKIRPRLISEVGVYYSPATFADAALNGVALENYAAQRIMAAENADAVTEVVGVGSLLCSMHVPWRVVTETTDDWSEFRTVIVPGAAALTETECEAMRRFVRGGGTLIATGRTSLTGGQFALADLFGVDYTGIDSPRVCYGKYDGTYVSASRPAPLTRPRPETVVRATLATPLYTPGDRDRYAAIHSDPPGVDTEFPAWTESRFGAGKCVYLALNVFGIEQDSQRDFSRTLLADYLPRMMDGAGLPEALEITLLRGAAGELLIAAVNDQLELPPIALADVDFRLRLPAGFEPESVVRVSDGASCPFPVRNGWLQIRAQRIEYGEMWLATPRPRRGAGL